MEDRRLESVSRPWAASVPVAGITAVAALRLMPGVEACVVGDNLWLRGSQTSDGLERALTRLAPTARFTTLAGGGLVPHGCRLPDGHLPPDAPWVPLGQLVRPQITSATLPASKVATVSLRLQRSADERPARVLVTSMRTFAEYADSAPAIRLHRLRFAADENHAVIWGEPLPPLPGERYAEQAGIAVPCGFAWRPAIDAPSLRRLMNLTEGDLALLAADGTWQHVPATSFVRARRSAVRLTMRQSEGTD